MYLWMRCIEVADVVIENGSVVDMKDKIIYLSVYQEMSNENLLNQDYDSIRPGTSKCSSRLQMKRMTASKNARQQNIGTSQGSRIQGLTLEQYFQNFQVIEIKEEELENEMPVQIIKQNEEKQAFRINRRSAVKKRSNPSAQNEETPIQRQTKYPEEDVMNNTKLKFRGTTYKNDFQRMQNEKTLKNSPQLYYNMKKKKYDENPAESSKYLKMKEGIKNRFQNEEEMLLSKYAQRFNINFAETEGTVVHPLFPQKSRKYKKKESKTSTKNLNDFLLLYNFITPNPSKHSDHSSQSHASSRERLEPLPASILVLLRSQQPQQSLPILSSSYPLCYAGCQYECCPSCSNKIALNSRYDRNVTQEATKQKKNAAKYTRRIAYSFGVSPKKVLPFCFLVANSTKIISDQSIIQTPNIHENARTVAQLRPRTPQDYQNYYLKQCSQIQGDYQFREYYCQVQESYHLQV